MKQVKIGLIGANWMGCYHSVGMLNVRRAYEDVEPIFEIAADINEAAARSAARRFGYRKITTDWRDVIRDPQVDLVIIPTRKSLSLPPGPESIFCPKNPCPMIWRKAKLWLRPRLRPA